MNCLKCSQQFNIQVNIPRLLPNCGHTLCEPCVKKLISSNFIVCPQCSDINLAGNQNDLPRNLAILTLKQQLKRTLRKQHIVSPQNNNNNYCDNHFKQVQNFCLDCSQYGCIQCLISHNKQHRIKCLEEVHFFLQDNLQQSIRKLKDMKLSYKLQRTQIQKTELLSTVNRYKTQIHSLFLQLKTLCEKKEQDALNFLKSLYDIQLIRLIQQQKQTKLLVDRYTEMQNISLLKTQKQIIQHYIDNKEIFIKGIQQFSDTIKGRNQQKTQLNKWQSHFNKFKDSTMKQIKQILNVKSLPISSTIPVKIQTKTPRDQARYYQANTRLNTATHINVKVNKIQQQNIPPKTSKGDIALSAYTSCKQTKSVILYGGYTDQTENKTSGIQIYGNNKVYEKYFGCIGHVKFGILEYNNSIFIFGGKVDNKRIDYIFSLPSLKQGFKIVGRLTKQKSGFGYCKLQDTFIVVGGNDQDVLVSCQEYSFDGFKLKKQLANLQCQRDQLSLTYHKGQIYAIGGYNSHSEISLKSVEVYSFETNTWSYIAQMNHPRRSHCSVSLPSGLFVVGGFDGVNYLPQIQRLNQQKEEWQIILELIHPRCTFGIAPIEQGFVVFGGFAKSPVKSCQICSIKEMKSRLGTNLNCNRFMHGCVTIGQSFKI